MNRKNLVSLAEFNRFNWLIWMTLAFQGGFINTGGFLSCHRFVSHTTGFASHFGVDLALGEYRLALGMLTVPLFFLVGAMVSGFLIDHQVASGKTAKVHLSFFLISTLMFFVAALGIAGEFGEFGNTLSISQDFTLIALLCFCCGLQNATITSASGAVVRTTHLTGITTDLGIGLIRLLSFKNSAEPKSLEIKSSFTRFALIVSFVIGSAASAFIFSHLRYTGFLIPAFISGALCLIVYRSTKPLN